MTVNSSIVKEHKVRISVPFIRVISIKPWFISFPVKMSFSLFKRKTREREEHPAAAVIGIPTNVIHDIHVVRDVTGALIGLPSAWQKQIASQLTEAEQRHNPELVKKVVNYYNFTKDKPENTEFKQIVTEKDIIDESKEIDEYMNSKDAHKSRETLTET